MTEVEKQEQEVVLPLNPTPIIAVEKEQQAQKKKTIAVCLPGESFSGRFLESWSSLLVFLISNGYRFVISRQESPVVYFARSMCLGGNVLLGADQKPFQSAIEYDYILWIDSDILFTPSQFETLLKHDKDIVSGMYMQQDNLHFATVKTLDVEYFKKNGTFQFMTQESLQQQLLTEEYRDSALVKVAYTGMGFMLVKKGVFESLKYPWFRPLDQKIDNLVDITSEDVSFCLQVQEKGYEIFVDPAVRVGHEKNFII